MSIKIISQSRKAVQISYEMWLKCRNMDASKKISEVTGILVSDFELFISTRRQMTFSHFTLWSVWNKALLNQQVCY